MDEELENNEWMSEAPFLAKMPRTNPFATPPGYFEGLEESINTAIYFENLKAAAGEINTSVPEGYFESLQDNINSRIAEENLKSQVQEDGFAVPAGYFESLNSRIISQIADEPKPQIKTQIFKLWHSKAMKYSTAACILIISALGLYLNQQQSTTTAPKVVQVSKATAQEQTLYDIDEQVIIDQVQTDKLPQVANTTATNSEMEDYILNNYSQNDIASNL